MIYQIKSNLLERLKNITSIIVDMQYLLPTNFKDFMSDDIPVSN